MRGIRLFGRIISSLLVAVLALLLVSNLYTIAARKVTGETHPTLFGVTSAVVVSGSMSGSIEVNDFVLICRQGEYEVGDIVSYDTGHSLVTHRIVEESEQGFITKGDANNTRDTEPVKPEDIVGKVVLVIPGVGKMIDYLRSPIGAATIVLIGFLLLAWPALFGSYRGKYSQGGKDDV